MLYCAVVAECPLAFFYGCVLYCAVVAECPLACVQAAQPHGRLERLLRVSSERKRLPGEKIAEEEYFIPSMPWSKCVCGSLMIYESCVSFKEKCLIEQN